MNKLKVSGEVQIVPARTKSWADHEGENSEFKDERLGKRFRILLDQLTDGVGQSIPFACQDWANTKAAYRFFSNPRVSEDTILSGHFHSTRDHFAVASGPVPVLHDTT